MRSALVVLGIAAAGCGRVGFDARGAAGDGAPGGDSSGTADSPAAKHVLALDRVDPGEVITDYPLLVDLTQVGVSDPANARFFDEDGNALAAELDGSGGHAWVRVPQISGLTTTLSVSDDPDAAPPPATPVWDADFAAVWHLDEPSGTARDATGHLDATAVGAPAASAGIVGGARQLDGTGSDYLVIADTSTLTPSAFTASAWVRPTSIPGGYFAVIAREVGNTTDNDIYLGLQGAQVLGTCQTASGEKDAAGGTLAAGVWSELAVVATSTTEHVYIDGVDVGETGIDGPLRSDLRPIFLGADRGGGAPLGQPDGDYLDGALDEARFQTTARSAAWIAFDRVAVLGGVISY